MTLWTWPAGITVELFYWSWTDRRPDRRIRGWSLADEVGATGAVRLEAERHRSAALRWVDPKGNPTVQHHTFASAAELPLELCDDDGQPLAWLRLLISIRLPFRTRRNPN
jgi:hypothetical protein